MIVIKDKKGVVLDTQGKYCEENIEVAIHAANLIPSNIKAGVPILGVIGTAELGSGGGGTDTSDATATAGDILAGVTAYGPDGLITGTIETYDGSQTGGTSFVVPDGTYEISENGTYDITSYASVDVDVPNVIPEGYIIPEGTIDITESGTYDVANYASANVNVAGGGGGDSLWSSYIAAKSDWRYLFAYSTETSFEKYLEGVDLSSVTNINYLFYNSRNLTHIPSNLDISHITNLTGFVNGCTSLTSVCLNTDRIVDLTSAFNSCSYLKTIDITSLDGITASYKSSGMCTYCYSLTKFIVRTMTIIPAINSNAFNSCHHILGTVHSTHNPNGLKDGYIYVPDDYVEQLKTATNWSNWADQIKGLSELVE